MDYLGLLVVFFPSTKKDDAIELLRSYGFDNILDIWEGKFNNEDFVPCTLGVHILREERDKWRETLYMEDSVLVTYTLDPKE